MQELHSHPRPYLWPTMLAAATVIGSLIAACLMPFAALATLAAATLRPRPAIAAVLGAWLVNQAIGFLWLGYPHTGQAAGQGATLALASLAALAVASVTGAASGSLPRLLAAFALAFAAYEAVMFAGAHLTGGLETFAPTVVAQIAVSEALWFALLVAGALAIERVAPKLAPHRAVWRAA